MMRRSPSTADSSRVIIVGLGNPGEKHRITRHNVAWLVLDALSDRVGCRFSLARD